MRATRQDRQQAEARAIALLAEAKTLRQIRAQRLRVIFAAHGDQGSLISGIERDHFPEPIKDMLRSNARAIGVAVEDSLIFWRMAGRRRSTWRPLAEAARVDGSRY